MGWEEGGGMETEGRGEDGVGLGVSALSLFDQNAFLTLRVAPTWRRAWRAEGAPGWRACSSTDPSEVPVDMRRGGRLKKKREARRSVRFCLALALSISVKVWTGQSLW